MSALVFRTQPKKKKKKVQQTQTALCSNQVASPHFLTHQEEAVLGCFSPDRDWRESGAVFIHIVYNFRYLCELWGEEAFERTVKYRRYDEVDLCIKDVSQVCSLYSKMLIQRVCIWVRRRKFKK